MVPYYKLWPNSHSSANGSGPCLGHADCHVVYQFSVAAPESTRKMATMLENGLCRKLLILFCTVCVCFAYQTSYGEIDFALKEYKLPDPGFTPSELEPHIDEATIRAHHGGHHLAYTTNLNGVLARWRDEVGQRHACHLCSYSITHTQRVSHHSVHTSTIKRQSLGTDPVKSVGL